MRFIKSVAVALGLALVALPAGAAIKAMSLSELMTITTDVVRVKILDKSTFHLDWPFPGCVYTKLKVEGESLRTLEPVATDVVFLGSHDARDAFSVSEAPTPQDTRVGSDAVIFFFRDPDMPGAVNNRIFGLDGVYRVEPGFGTPVVIGKGEGFAFPDNVKLADVRAAVRATHLELAASAPSGK